MSNEAFDLDQIVEEAFVYLYPAVLMDITRKQLTGGGAGVGLYASMNEFNHLHEYPPLDFTAVVRTNFDTLYSSAWLDLTNGPVVLSVPDSGGRYYLLPTLSMWTDAIASPGWRTTGTDAQEFIYLPPGWEGEVPDGLDPIQCPTNHLWIVGRIQTNGPDDYAAVNEFQDALKLTPLDKWGSDYSPAAAAPDSSVDQTAPLEQVAAMSTKDFFEYALEILKLNPPNTTDSSQIWRMRHIGITVGQSFDFDSLDEQAKASFERGRVAGYAKMLARANELGTPANGWMMLLGVMGSYGIQYLQRAAVALAGLGANQLDDAYYPLLIGDRGPTTDPVVLHFEADEIPPVSAYWSVTLYDSKGFPIPNELNRGAIADWMDLKYGEDGSLDLYIQPESPGPDKESNWLPSPADKAWNLTLRLYAPKPAALDGTWQPPELRA